MTTNTPAWFRTAKASASHARLTAPRDPATITVGGYTAPATPAPLTVQAGAGADIPAVARGPKEDRQIIERPVVREQVPRPDWLPGPMDETSVMQ